MRRRARAALALATLAAWGCAATPPAPAAGTAPAPAGPAGRAGKPALVLLGEVHDHEAHHAARAAWFREHLAGGARPALALEMFDRERQAAIDAVLVQALGPARDRPLLDPAARAAAVEALIDAGAPGRRGWDWRFYRPFLDAALAHALPVIAANVSREDTRRVMREGLQAGGFVAEVPPDIARVHAERMLASHCGLIDEPTAAHMAKAQAARDQFMARVVAAQAGRGSVLLTGHGHARRDIGIVRWLPAEVARQVRAIGHLEAGDPTPASAFDEIHVAAPQPRPDPCASMRRGPA
jgi:uncharacterized iron-regulated protein